ncbi:MAG: MMPL family transporter [Bacteroidales bacterium]|nr:MMPL family transporter [Bacteroidales bacterium]
MERRQKLFYTLLLSSAVFFAWFGLKIDFEEDISKLLPSVEQGGAEELVFSNLKVKDKIFIQFRAMSGVVDPDTLTELCDAFVQVLLEKDTAYHTIQNVLYQIDEDMMANTVSYLYEHVPVFLDSAHFQQIDAILTQDAVETQMDENYTMLRSPAGSTLKDIIVRDPVGLHNILREELTSISNGLGGNYGFYNRYIVTPDTSAALLFLSPNFKSFDSKQNIRLVELIEETIAQFRQQNADVEILYHGMPVRGVYNSKRIKADLWLTISISLVLVCFLLVTCFKNKSTLLFLIAPVIYGVIFSLSVVYFIKGTMSLMSIGIGAIVMGVAFSYCLHIITHRKYVNDPVRLLKDQTVPVILGVLTTIGAFMSLMLTESELLQDFGLFASLGLAGTALFGLLFLPQLFRLQTDKKSETFTLLEKINSFPFERQRWLIALILTTSVVCFFFSGRVRFDSDLRNIGYHEPKVVRSETLLAEKVGDNLATVYFAGTADNLDSALIAAQRMCVKLDTLTESGKIKGYTTAFSYFVPTDEQQRRIDRWNAYWTDAKKADTRRKVTDAAAKYRFSAHAFDPFFNMLDAKYEPVSLYEADIVPKEILDNIIENMDDKYLVFVPVRMREGQMSEIGDYLVRNVPRVVVIDPMFYTGNMVKMIHNDFNVILGVSSLFVLIVLLLSFKSVILAVLAFLPMCLSWYIVLGIMAIFDIEFNLINIIISSFIFGVGVDYSIFIMDGLLATYRRKESLLTYHKTAIFFSAVILIIVVVSLLFAVHPAISSIGTSTLIGMVATILIAYSLQPFFFSLLITDRTAKRKAPIAIAHLFTWGNKTPQRAIRDNYRYKGFNVERRLSAELKKTRRYAALTAAVLTAAGERKSMLEYGCGAGFCSYWASIINGQMNITGFDTDASIVALAANGYLKTDNMRFTTDIAVLNEAYDVAVIRKAVQAGAERTLFANVKTLVLHKDLTNTYQKLLTEYGFSESNSFSTGYAPQEEDELFGRWEKLKR